MLTFRCSRNPGTYSKSSWRSRLSGKGNPYTYNKFPHEITGICAIKTVPASMKLTSGTATFPGNRFDQKQNPTQTFHPLVCPFGTAARVAGSNEKHTQGHSHTHGLSTGFMRIRTKGFEHLISDRIEGNMTTFFLREESRHIKRSRHQTCFPYLKGQVFYGIRIYSKHGVYIKLNHRKKKITRIHPFL